MLRGFEYIVRHRRGGTLLHEQAGHNLIPDQGVNHTLGVVLLGQSQHSTWRVGIYEGDYTPNVGDTMAGFPAAATECISYNETTRPLWVPGAISSGRLGNDASVASFTMNNVTAKTIYGHFLSSSDVKGGVVGTLLSAVRYTSPRLVVTGDVFEVVAFIRLFSN